MGASVAQVAPADRENAVNASGLMVPGVSLPLRTVGAKRSHGFERVLTIVERLADFVTVFFAVEMALLVASVLAPANAFTVLRITFGVSAGVALLASLMLDGEGAYRRGNSLLHVRETERVLKVSAQLFVLAFVVDVFLYQRISLWTSLLLACFSMVCLVIQKQALYQFVRSLHAKGFGVRRVVIFGAGHTGRRVFSALVRSPKLGLNPVAVVDEDERVGPRMFECSYTRERSAPVVHGALTPQILKEQDASMLVIAIPSLGRDKFVRVFEAAISAGVEVAFVPNHYLPSDMWIEDVDVDGLMLSSFGETSQRQAYEFLKRIFDFIGAALMCVLFAPVMAVIALLIRLDSPGRVFFKQERVGKDGRVFGLYKFRTMFVESPAYGYSPLESTDPRITRFGRFLRRTSLDELPQLLNVLRGEMSLVGPRPEMPFIVQDYEPLHRQRLQVKAGITGLWQISADRAFLIHENIEYDLYYIRHRSFFMDLAILLHTAIFAMRGV